MIFTAKDDITDPDKCAAFQKQLGAGIAVVGNKALLTTVHEDTAEHLGGVLFFDIQAQLASGGTPKTVAFGELQLIRDVTRKLTTSVPVVTTNPPLQFGKSAYDIAVENGFVGTVEEWLAYIYGDMDGGDPGSTFDDEELDGGTP